MIKHHFVALAEALRQSRPVGFGSDFYQWGLDIAAVAAVCKRFGPKFDHDRFMAHVMNTQILTKKP